MPKQTTRPQRPASWPDYAPDPPKRTSSGRRNPWPALIVIMLVLGSAFGGLGLVGLRYMQNQSAAPVQKDAKAATSARSTQAAKEQSRTVARGTVIRDEDFAFKVTRVRSRAGQTLVYVVVKNVSTEPQTLVPSIQQLRGADGRSYPANAGSRSTYSERLWNEIPAGKARRGIMVFEVGTSARPAEVELHGSIASAGIRVKA